MLGLPEALVLLGCLALWGLVALREPREPKAKLEPPGPKVQPVRWAQRARQVQRERKARQEFRDLLARPEPRGPRVWLGPQDPPDLQALREQLAQPDRWAQQAPKAP